MFIIFNDKLMRFFSLFTLVSKIDTSVLFICYILCYECAYTFFIFSLVKITFDSQNCTKKIDKDKNLIKN